MKANNTYTQPFIVTRDGAVDKKLSVFEAKLTPADIMLQYLKDRRLQFKIALYDVLHGTQYRKIRNHLISEMRNRQFEQFIGLTR